MRAAPALTLAVLATCALLGAAASPPVFGIYVDSAGINWAAQPPTPIVDVRKTAYSHVYASFFLPSLNQTTDFASVLTNPNPAYGGPCFVDATHQAGKKILLAVGGATELPTTPTYFTANDPTRLAQTLASLVKTFGIDGIMIDWEDDYSNNNPGLTGYGETRAAGSGPAVPWLITLTQTLRTLLPRQSGYIIGHAPQPPYFALGYDAVHAKVGSLIDYYALQFYNQGPGVYETYETLVIKEHIYVNTSCVPYWDGSITDLVKNHGIPEAMIVVGKIIATTDGSNGYIAPNDLVQDLSMARKLFPGLGGVAGWQWGSDTNGTWIATVSGGFKSPAHVEGERV